MDEKICKHLQTIKDFGLELWVLKKLCWILYPRNLALGYRVYERRHKVILKYLEKHFGNTIVFSSSKIFGKISSEAPIWICWWQGVENAPELVQECIKSIKNNSGAHPVRIITEENYKQYLEIPERMWHAFKEHKILPAHMADYLRCALLEKYGGIWCDATLYMTDDFTKDIDGRCFYTMKNSLEYYPRLEIEPSKCFWRIFFMASVPDNPLFSNCRVILEKWLLSGKPLIDYFTLDYIFLWLYQKDAGIKQMLDDVPYNNQIPYVLVDSMNSPFDAEQWKKVCESNYIHKLSTKVKISSDEGTYYDVLFRVQKEKKV